MPDYLEIERKYEADAAFVLPPLDALPGVAAVSAPETFRLDATYYDTADLTLIGHKITLRRRTGGSDEGWHLKLPVQGDARTEVREPLGAADVPAALSSRVGHLVTGRSLAPVATLRTGRTVRRLSDQAGRPLAEVADDHVTARRLAPPAGEPFSWREIEVELLGDGPADLLDAAGQLLLRAGARPARSASKLARALGTT